MTSSRTWANSALPQMETGAFRLEFDATPASSGIDGVVGLSSGPAGPTRIWPRLSGSIPRGRLMPEVAVLYGGSNDPVLAGTSYHFILDVNLTAHTYNASVVVSGAQVVIGTKLAVRFQQARVSSLSNIAAVATLEARPFERRAIGGASGAFGYHTAAKPDGHRRADGDFLRRGVGTAPMSYQWRKNGAAISGATASTYQTPSRLLRITALCLPR